MNHCINAGGGKDSKAVMQIIGRGTRISEGKTKVHVWDFVDTQKTLSDHFFERLNVYASNGWKVRVKKM